MRFRTSASHLARLICVLFVVSMTGTAIAAEQNTQTLSDNGWYSDDTRADGSGTQSQGTNLVSPTLTDDPEATATGTSAHDADILQQIQFVVPPGTVPLGTHPYAVNLNIAAAAGSGKSQISHRKDDVTGHGPGSGFGPGFTAEYSWMGDGTSTVTASLKFGIRTSEFGSTGVSSRTGENAWDKVLIYEPGNLNGGLSDGTWQTESIDYNNGVWWLYDRTAGAGTIGNTMTLADMATSTDIVSGSKTIQDVYNLITTSGVITSVQFGIGSGNAGGNVYVNQLETNVYRSGDTTTFGYASVHNLTQATDHMTIQDAVDNALAGDVIQAEAGIYTEQVVIDKDLTLQGAGAGSTIIASPASLTASFTTSNVNYPVVYVHDTADVVIEDLTVDGQGLGNANYRFVGVGYWNAGGRLTDLEVIRIEDTPFSGSQHGIALYAANNTGGPYALEVGNCTFTDFQKNAMALTSSGLTVDVHDCTTTGKGPTTVTAQNGIQISSGAAGTVSDCAISDVDYTPSTYVASGLLTYSAGNVTVSGLTGANAITNCQAPVSWYSTNGSIDGIQVSGTGSQWQPIFVYNQSASKAMGPDEVQSRPMASAFDAGWTSKAGLPSTAASMTVSISNACLTGTGTSSTSGIEAYSLGGALDVTVTNSVISNWDYGLVVDDAVTVLTAHDNAIFGNLTAGYENTLSGNPQDATLNWWGAADGPSGDGSGSGDVVTGGGVSFDPWRVDGTSVSAGCSFVPEDNPITPNPPALCISTINPCVTVPFEIARTDNVPMRGYSVTFTLSPELQLCSGLASIVEDTYLNSVGGTNFLVLDNGGGSYTVDAAILGIPCGATATSGTLFTIGVTNSGGDGTGTITVTSVTARDCVNAPIGADAGGSGTITIDNSLPTAIADLAATQVKTGNDVDGTTKITLTWSPVEAGATVAVYRKGFGSYPEYDDAGGSAPSAPTDPSNALSNGWTLTGVTTSGATDEVTTRDFYYYVAFITDECGNVSPVSNRTDGTLNYHLGDVTNGTPGLGDNDVGTIDISLLGANYGISLAPADPVNYLDVGPTTDYSVDALPTTDNVVQFEDLMMFAINFDQVSKPDRTLTLAAFDELTLEVPESVEPGTIVAVPVWMAGAGNVQGMSVALRWNERVVEPVGVETGALLAEQNGLALSASPGVVDVALLGTRDHALAGEGVVAKVMFRVLGQGDAQIGIASVDARDSANQRVDLGTDVRREDTQAVPRVTALLQNVPNPFNPMTTIAFTLAVPGTVELAIYDVSGRRVQTLATGQRDAGRHEVVWNGTDASGARVSSGIYYMRLTTPDGRFSRPMTLLK